MQAVSFPADLVLLLQSTPSSAPFSKEKICCYASCSCSSQTTREYIGRKSLLHWRALLRQCSPSSLWFLQQRPISFFTPTQISIQSNSLFLRFWEEKCKNREIGGPRNREAVQSVCIISFIVLAMIKLCCSKKCSNMLPLTPKSNFINRYPY